MLTTLRGRLAAMKAAPGNIDSALETIDDMREQITSFRAERSAVANAPRPLAEIMAALDDHLDRAATDAVDRLRLARILDRRVPVQIALPIAPHRNAPVHDTVPAVETLLGLVIAVARDPLRDLIAGQIEDMMDGREPLTDAQIATRVTEIERALLAAELAEEGAIRSLESAGISVDRRAEADPRAVLAADSALPSG